MSKTHTRPRVVIVGAGFAGLECARALRGSNANVVVIDRRNHHLFQPLLYQVATAALSPSSVAAPIRKVFRRQRNCSVLMGEVESIDTQAGFVGIDERQEPFDYLVLACGMTHNYFGNEQWQAVAPGLKNIEEAIEIRRRVLMSFELAELEPDERARRSLLTFVIVGGGPTGVELAGAIAEIATQSIPRDFRRVDTRQTRVVLVEGGDRLLAAYHPELSSRAERDLVALGVEVLLGDRVSEIDEAGVTVGKADGATRIESRCVIWAAGLKGEPLASSLNIELTSDGRVAVEADLSVPGHDRIFVVGDLMAHEDPKSGEPVPGVAQGAMQSGRFVGRIIASELEGRPSGERGAFHYHDKGSMATIGRAKAVAEIGSWRFGGLFAWMLWSIVHVAFLVGFRNKLIAMFQWAYLYTFWSRGSRLITGTCTTGKGDALG